MKKLLLIGLILALAFLAFGCSDDGNQAAPPPTQDEQAEPQEVSEETADADTQNEETTGAPAMQIDIKKNYYALIQTNLGNIKIKFFPKDAPNTVNNFVALARKGFYDGVIFHRVVKEFVIQGGDPEGTGSGGPGYQFDDEINSNKHLRGRVSMAHAGANTNGSQFFIVTADSTSNLDGVHTVFGEVVEGMATVDKIEATETGYGDRPVEPIRMIKVTIEEK